MAGSKKKRFQITTTLPKQLVRSVESMAKQNDMTKSAIVEKLCWLGHGSLAADSCIEAIGELRQAVFECEKEGGAVDDNLIAHANDVINESLHVLDNMRGRGSASLHGVLKVLIDVTGRATAINEDRWIKGAVESAEKVQ